MVDKRMEGILIAIFIALVFFLLTQLIPPFYQWKFWKNLQTQKIYNEIQKHILATEKGILKLGNISIEQIIPLYVFPTPDRALTSIDVSTEFREEEKIISKELSDLKYTYLQEEIEKARQKNQNIDNNLSYSLDSVGSERVLRDNVRIHNLILKFSPTDFYKFVMINLALDKPILERGSGDKVSIRDAYRLSANEIDPDHLEKLPVHLRFGTNTVVVTKENMIVLSARSGRQYIVPGGSNDFWNTHISVAEGMLRPTDQNQKGRPDPFSTVIRGLKDELSLKADIDFSKNDIKFLALYLDIKRLQPIGVFLLKIEMPFEKIVERRPVAPDRTENKFLFPLPFHTKDVYKLLKNECCYQYGPLNKKCYMVSNQARASLSLSLFYDYSLEEIMKDFEV